MTAPITATQAGLEAWLAAFRPRALQAGIRPETLDRYLPKVSLRLDVLDRDRRQDEFTRTIWDYLDRAVSDDRVANGRKALAVTFRCWMPWPPCLTTPAAPCSSRPS